TSNTDLNAFIEWYLTQFENDNGLPLQLQIDDDYILPIFLNTN
ncbi:unnamed protein product, partial [Didymodactylos carnosus]